MTPDTAYIGIDPGASGYICLLVPSTGLVYWIQNNSTPKQLMNWVNEANRVFVIPKIMLEQVASIPKSSAKSNFGFGFNYGTISTICRLTDIGLDYVRPQVWQKTIGLAPKSTSIKKDIAAIAERLYPSISFVPGAPVDKSIYGPKGGLQDGKSDSLMIAHYSFKIFTK
jgi:hypothetical protein